MSAQPKKVLPEKPKKKKQQKKNSGKHKKARRKGVKMLKHILPLAMSALPLLLKAGDGRPPTALQSGSKNYSTYATAPVSPLALANSSDIVSGITKRDPIYGADGVLSGTLLQGSETLGTLEIPANALAGDKIYSFDFQPLSSSVFSGSRLKPEMVGFSRWKVKEAFLRVTTAQAAIVPGQLAGCFLIDPEQEIPDSGGAEAQRIVLATEGHDLWQIWSNGMVLYPADSQMLDATWLYTNPIDKENLLTSAGSLNIITMLANDTALPVEVGTVELFYTLHLTNPTIEQGVTVEQSAYIACGTGATSCTDTLPLGSTVTTAPYLTYDQIGILDLSGAGFTMPAGDWLILWAMSVATSMSISLGAYEGIITTPGGQVVSDWVVNQTDAISTATRIHLSEPIYLNFGTAGVSSVTGETVVVNNIRICADPFSSDGLAFGRTKRVLAIENAKSRTRTAEFLQVDNDRALLKRLEQLEIALVDKERKLEPKKALPALSSSSVSGSR